MSIGIYAHTFTKEAKNKPWKVTLSLTDNIQEATTVALLDIGDYLGGYVKVKDKLKKLLQDIQPTIKSYPYQLLKTDERLDPKDYDFYVNTIGINLADMEINPQAEKNLRKRLFPQPATAKPIPKPAAKAAPKPVVPNPAPKQTANPPKPKSTAGSYQVPDPNYVYVSERYPTTGHVLEGELTNVEDGDTIWFKVTKMGENSKKYFTIGQEVQVRFVGIQAPEIIEHAKGQLKDYSDKKNDEYALQFHTTRENVYQIAKESTRFVERLLYSQNTIPKMVVVQIDVNADGSPAMDTHADGTSTRNVGIVYRPYLLRDKDKWTVNRDLPMINVNKSIVGNPSSIDGVVNGAKGKIPLAIVESVYYYNVSDSSIFDVALWDSQYALGHDTKTKAVAADAKAKADAAKAAMDKEMKRLLTGNGRSTTVNITLTVDKKTDLDKLAKEYGISIAKIAANNQLSVEELKKRVKEGKVTKIVVPQVRNGEVAKNEDGSYTIANGAEFVDNALNFFDELDDRGLPKSDYHVRIGDVELVIPPLMIQVTKQANVQKVKTLRSKSSIITKAGSSQTSVVMQLYFHNLDSINGFPLGAYDKEVYYMHGLRSLVAQFKKAPFLPVQNELLNEVHDIHAVALSNISITTVPGFPHSLSVTLTLTPFEQEAYMPGTPYLDNVINYPMLRWYYQQAMKDQGPYRTYLAPIEGGLTNDFQFKLADEDTLKERKEAIRQIRNWSSLSNFQGKLDTGGNNLGKMIQDAKYVQQALDQYKRYLATKKAMGANFPKTIKPGDDVFKKIYGADTYESPGFYMAKEIELNTAAYGDLPVSYQPAASSAEGDVYVQLTSTVNQAKLVRSDELGLTNQYKFPLNDPVQKSILDNAAKADQAAAGYKYDYTQLKIKAEGSEGTLPMNPYNISNMHLTGIQVMLENTFASAQLGLLTTPTLQYLGAQEPYIRLTFETTDRKAVAELQNMLSEADRYSKEYRYGITSGFMDFENQLTRLMGIRSVIPETVNINTVPGFSGRFQIEMTLCGFDKTQKRTESLDGINAVNKDTTMKDRLAVNDPQHQDELILELKMLDLEVYPDLELPTYDEINQVLDKIQAGINMYENRTGAKYLDPDFYISTKWTFRQHIQQEKAKNHVVKIADLSGFKGTVEVNVPADRASEFPDSTTNNSLGLTVTTGFKSPQIEELNKVADELDQVTATLVVDVPKPAPTAAPDLIGPPIPQDMVGPQEVKNIHKRITNSSQVDGTKDWAKDANNITQPPSEQELRAWMGGGTSNLGPGAALSMLKNPSSDQVYQEILSHVKRLWVANGYAIDGDLKKEGLYKDVTFATVEDMWRAAEYTLFQKAPKFAKNKKKIDPPKGIDVNAYAAQFYKSQRVLTTVDRIVNLLKSVFEIESGWKQFESKNGGPTPKLNPTSKAMGIGQIISTWLAQSPADARRLAWDWTWNIRRGIEMFFDKYTRAADSANIEYACRPWDWAVQAYETGSLGKQLATPYYTKTMGVFGVKGGSSADKIYNTPSLAYASPATRPNGKNDDKVMAAAHVDAKTADILAAQSSPAAAALALTSQPGIIGQGILSKLAGQEVNTGQEIDNNSGMRLTYDGSYNDPVETFHGMMTDMAEYDQRGRLIRAFPTFQMFLIDEGRWMTRYKLWDNLYGYNAIQSIDVHKSKKIAADTAIIKMTNVYSNLTSRQFAEDYGDWQYNWYDNLLWGNPNEELINARKEFVSSMMLETGARIHLRMGYSANAANLPVMFNGTITEMNTEDVIEIIAQGDGLELTNPISSDPNDTNTNGIGVVQEPRDLICTLLTSKGNWFKDALSWTSNGLWFQDNPLGIQHFGAPIIPPEANYKFFNHNYGEAAQNIYSSNGCNTFSQWIYGDGSKIPWDFGGFVPTWGGDEKDIKLKLYNKSTWDIAQAIAYMSPDYIAAVHPFELRSTLFFGKPYYKVAYRYESSYAFNDKSGQWDRKVVKEIRKPYRQVHILDANTDIIQNRIKASSDGIYTNVIATWAGGQTNLMSADRDIRFDKQSTAIVEAPIFGSWFGQMIDFWTTEKQAMYFAASTLRDYMMEMYKGRLTILGDPTIKPHDQCYMNDPIADMNGSFFVRSVTHHFSFETGFISSIEPDAFVVNDDKAIISHGIWLQTIGMGAVSYWAGKKAAARAVRKMAVSSLAMKGGDVGKWVGRSMMRMASWLPDKIPTKEDIGDGKFKTKWVESKEIADYKASLKLYLEAKTDAEKEQAAKWMDEAYKKMETTLNKWEADGILKKGTRFSPKRLLYTSNGILTAIRDGATVGKFLKTGGMILTAGFGIFNLATLGLTVVAETIAEMYRRKKWERQAVLMMPLQYQNRAFTAGINGHQGMVVGEHPGKWDQFFAGAGYNGNDDASKIVAEGLNWLLDDGTVQGSTQYSFAENYLMDFNQYGTHQGDKPTPEQEAKTKAQAGVKDTLKAKSEMWGSFLGG